MKKPSNPAAAFHALPPSAHWNRLLERQHALQVLSGFPLPEATQVAVALTTELGELFQVLKPTWAWWKKDGDADTVDPERVLDEAADVLHFLLLRDMVTQTEQAHAFKLDVWSGVGADWSLWDLMHDIQRGTGWAGACSLATLLSGYGKTPDDLILAYWNKGDENVRRWAASPQPVGSAP